jgi:hypothetical protein
MQKALSQVSGELYAHEVVHRGLNLGERAAPIAPSPRPVRLHDAPGDKLRAPHETRPRLGHTQPKRRVVLGRRDPGRAGSVE